MAEPAMSGDGWWTEAFRAAYLEVYHHRTDEQAAAEVAGLLPRLRAARGPVVDAACGAGRHLAALRAAGIPAIGFDLSRDLLAAAQGRAGCRGLLVCGDVRRPPCAGGVAAVLSLFTGFGYFDDAGNAACLRTWASLLAPDGWLVLDVPEPAGLRATLRPESVRTTPRGWRVDERRSLVGSRVEKMVIATPPDGVAITWRESVRLYDRPELIGLANGAGLRLAECWPGLGGPDDQAGRMVCWFTKSGGGSR